MPPSSPPHAGGTSHKRRQYAKDQTAAYDYSGGSISGGIPGVGGAYGAPGHQDPAQQSYPGGQQHQFFSPALGDPAAPQQPLQSNFYGNSGPNYQAPIGPGAPVHGRSISQQYPGQQQGYQQPGVAGLSNQFGQMGIGGQRPVSLTDLRGLFLAKAEVLRYLGPSADNQSHRLESGPSWPR